MAVDTESAFKWEVAKSNCDSSLISYVPPMPVSWKVDTQDLMGPESDSVESQCHKFE